MSECEKRKISKDGTDYKDTASCAVRGTLRPNYFSSTYANRAVHLRKELQGGKMQCFVYNA